jgi:hypothetical protein
MSHVYIPPSGLVNVEVSGGNAHLKAGETDGWIASEAITCPDGYRYDIVSLEVETPGSSYVEISMLNASASPTEIGFANETISGFKLKAETDISVYAIRPKMYPDIRIQVTFHANGSATPRLLSWTLFYVGLEEWRDDFRSATKMSDHRGLNFTGGALEVNVSEERFGSGNYKYYPTITWGGGVGSFDFFYANAERNGYLDASKLTIPGGTAAFADFNGDDNIDVVISYGGGTSKILWGDGSERYSTSRTHSFNTPSTTVAVAVGDVNGDGWTDVAFAATNTGSGTRVFLNQGYGTFNAQPDIDYSGRFAVGVYVGDVNGDGYDEVIYSGGDTSIFWGGENGPDTTPDVYISGRCLRVVDVNGDGRVDLITTFSGEYRIHLGEEINMDSIADHTLPEGTGIDAGYINGDDYVDIAVISGSGCQVFEGANDGWSTDRVHEITDSPTINVKVGDIDKDGFEDILTIEGPWQLAIYPGGTSWPSSHTIKKSTTGMGGSNLAVAIPKGQKGILGYSGSFTTEWLNLPVGKRWDILHMDGILPLNTSAKVTLLDSLGAPIKGYEDLEKWSIDLTDIIPALHRTLKIKVNMLSEFNNTTPVLDLLMVKWMDEMVWRDQFYGMARTDRLLNLEVVDNGLTTAPLGGSGPQLIFPSIRGDDGYTTVTQGFLDAGSMDYLDRDPIKFKTKGTSAVDVADVDGDGYLDVAFAVHHTDDGTYTGKSPIFLGTPVGLKEEAEVKFPTTGASDVLLRDLNDDGHVDVVFAQEKDNATYSVNSTLFWGSADGFSDTADIEFTTTGAAGVVAADLDEDGLLDLVFACYSDDSTKSIDSMVFLQGSTGFNGTTVSQLLATEGARAVAVGDIDGDTHSDVVFANSLSSGTAEIDSLIYWGKGDGSFEVSTKALATSGAEDVKLADVDGDSDLDVVFANYQDNTQVRAIDSAVYLNDGSGAFSSSPDHLLPTKGAIGLAVADIDGTGWKDLVFACEHDGFTFATPSAVFLGGATGWSSTPDILLPTEGARDVAVAPVIDYDAGGYLSTPIVVNSRLVGDFHTFRYDAALESGVSGKVHLVDRYTWEVLAETDLVSGQQEWSVKGLFKVKDHPAIRVLVTVEGLDAGNFDIDDLWLNWTERIKRPPQLHGVELDSTSIYRNEETVLWVNVSDEYDLVRELQVSIQHRLNGTTGAWDTFMLRDQIYDESSDAWRVEIRPFVSAPLGMYDFQATVTDKDFMASPWVEFPRVLEVLNNLPSAPEVRIMPTKAVTTSTLKVEIVTPSYDVETSGLTYQYAWYKDGLAIDNVTTETLSSLHTSRGQNWSVEVSAFDGDDQGPVGLAWRIIENAPPVAKDDLPDPQFDEDTTDTNWLDLSTAFEDPDGDTLTWSLKTSSDNLGVTIDPTTGQVTLTPVSNWFGEEILTFIASDGEFNVTQTVTMRVVSVNDLPIIDTVEGEPVASDTIEYTVMQGELLEISFTVFDVEGDEVLASVNSSAVTLDEDARLITFHPENDDVGILRFGLYIYDVETPNVKVLLNFIVVIENTNDEMEDPLITSPSFGESFMVNQSFSLVGMCDDPDIQWGQVLNYSWESNISGILGYGSSINVRVLEPGRHRITLTVRDPDYTKTVTVDVLINPREDVTPPPPPDNDDQPSSINWALIIGIVAVLGILGAVLFMVAGKRKTEQQGTQMDYESVKVEKKETVERIGAGKRAVGDEREPEREGAEMSEVQQEIEIETDAIPSTGLSMEVRKTEAASEETEKLFAGISDLEPEETEEEREALRIDNLMRTYQNAIGRLPYGIPSKELVDRDWVDLAAALATGEKKILPDGQETTEIDGRWYYSDVKDTGTFLKEHGAKPKKEEPKKKEAVPAADKTALLAKLEERFIMGDISEKAYEELKRKYGE